MNIYDALEDFTRNFSIDEYVLAGGLAVSIQTGVERETNDIDIIVRNTLTDNQLGDLGSRLYSFSSDRNGLRMDVVRGLDYLKSITFTPELLERNINLVEYRGRKVPTLSREALAVSKLTCLYHSEPEKKLMFYTTPLFRPKDIQDVRNLYDAGINDDTMIELLGHVNHLDGINVDLFYDVGKRIMSDGELPIEIAKNSFGISRIGSLMGRKQREVFVKAVKERLSGKDVSEIAMLLDEVYDHCLKSSNPLRTFKRLITER